MKILMNPDEIDHETLRTLFAHLQPQTLAAIVSDLREYAYPIEVGSAMILDVEESLSSPYSEDVEWDAYCAALSDSAEGPVADD